jgi:acetyl-CoA carboxylase carboxyl transferase subunit alpha
MHNFLEFEKPIAELEGKLEELRRISSSGDVNITDEVGKLQVKLDRLLKQTYGKLTAWQKTQVARHPDRPHAAAVIGALVSDFIPLAGDRAFAEDPALIGGLGRWGERSVVVIGSEKGNDTESRVRHNFGMARPEGYRKAQRLMRLAERFALPVVTLVDTPGAYPGVDAEARGQAEAIARGIETCLDLKVPIVTVILGEGGSGGAMALACADRVLMLEYAIYSVISPEGCASILWRDGSGSAEVAAEALKLTAQDLKQLGVADRIIEEPVGGAHRTPERAIAAIGEAVTAELGNLVGQKGEDLRTRRRQKFLAIGRTLPR